MSAFLISTIKRQKYSSYWHLRRSKIDKRLNLLQKDYTGRIEQFRFKHSM